MATDIDLIRELYRYNSKSRQGYLRKIWQLPTKERYRDLWRCRLSYNARLTDGGSTPLSNFGSGQFSQRLRRHPKTSLDHDDPDQVSDDNVVDSDVGGRMESPDPAELRDFLYLQSRMRPIRPGLQEIELPTDSSAKVTR